AGLTGSAGAPAGGLSGAPELSGGFGARLVGAARRAAPRIARRIEQRVVALLREALLHAAADGKHGHFLGAASYLLQLLVAVLVVNQHFLERDAALVECATRLIAGRLARRRGVENYREIAL